MPPNFSTTSLQNRDILGQLDRWATADGRGFVIDSSGGYVLPSGARRSPDASWTPKHLVRQLPLASRDTYWHLCPAFVIELRSKTDRLPALRQKMHEYLDNGAQLGWLIDPQARSVEVFRPNKKPELLSEIDTISGEGPVAGFTLDLRLVWDPFA